MGKSVKKVVGKVSSAIAPIAQVASFIPGVSAIAAPLAAVTSLTSQMGQKNPNYGGVGEAIGGAIGGYMGANEKAPISADSIMYPNVQFGSDQSRALYGKRQIAPQSQYTLDGLQKLAGGDVDTQSLTNLNKQTSDMLGKTINGDYLNGNPYIDNVIEAANRDGKNAVQSSFAGSGRYGSGLFADTLNRQSSDLSSKVRFDNYNNERGRQLQAGGMTPQITQNAGAIADIGRQDAIDKLKSGNISEEYNQRVLDAPQTAIDEYLQRLQGLSGVTNGLSVDGYAKPNKFGSAVGGALQGAATGSAISDAIGGVGGIVKGIGGLFGKSPKVTPKVTTPKFKNVSINTRGRKFY